MNNNDILRQLGSALDLSSGEMVAIFNLAGFAMKESTLLLLLKQEDEDGFIPCANPLLSFFLEGLIVHRRGRLGQADGQPARPDPLADRNAILKKLRIALDLKEGDMLTILKLGGATLSKSELSSLFRARDNKHYKECSGQLLESFLHGVALHYHR